MRMIFRKRLSKWPYQFWLVLGIIAFLCTAIFVSTAKRDTLTRDVLTWEERQWLTENDGNIRLGPDPEDPPFDFFDESGNYIGLTADYVRKIEEKLGFKFKIVRLGSWDELLTSSREGKVDIICAAKWTPDRDKYLLFTKPFVHNPNVIITNKDFTKSLSIEDLRGKKVIMRKGTAALEIIRKKYPWLDIKESMTTVDGLLDISFKRADAMILHVSVASYLVEKENIGNIRVAGHTDIVLDLGIASRKDLPILNSILDKGLALITQREKDAIFNKWIHLGGRPFYKMRKFWLTVCVIITVVLLVLASMFIWNRTLKYQVSLRTKELKESEERYRVLVEGTENFVTRVDREGRFIFVNQASGKIFGLKPEECIGLSALDFAHPDDCESTKEAFARWLRDKSENITFENRQVSRTGEVRDMLWTCNSRFDESGEVVWIDSIARDITERKRAEEALRESEEKFRMLVVSLPVGVFLDDAQGNATYINEKCAELVGLPVEDALNLDWMSSIHPNDRERVATEWAKAVKNGEKFHQEYRWVHADGEVVWTIGDIIPVIGSDGEVTVYIGTLTDITERKQAEERERLHQRELAHASRLSTMGQMASELAHEINQPLCAIMGRAESSLRTVKTIEPKNDDLADQIETIVKQTERAGKIVSRIRHFTVKNTNVRNAVYLNEVVSESLGIIGYEIKSGGIKIDLDLDNTKPIHADLVQIEQVILNLIQNGIEALQETHRSRRTLTISTKNLDGSVEVAITDSGSGIDEEYLENVFESFFTTKNKGLGIGLSICRSIIESHGGKLNFRDNSANGVTFYFTLPI